MGYFSTISFVRWCPYVVIAFCSSALVLGAISLWVGGLQGMPKTTSLFIIASSITLLLAHPEHVNPIRYRIARIMAACLFLGSLFTILSTLHDPPLTHDPITYLLHLNFILFSASLFFIDNHFFNDKRIISICVSIIFLNASFSLVGYIFINDPDYPIVAFTRMSIFVSAAFLLLCLALLLARPHRGLAQRLLDHTVDAALLRRIPFLLFLLTLAMAYLTNIGENAGWYDDGFSDLLAAMGSILILIMLLVITSNKLRKQEKRGDKNKALFLGFSENVNEVFWQTTPAGDKILYVSPAFEKIWAKPRAALNKNPLLWFESIHPADQPTISQQLLSLTQQENSTSLSLEYRIILPDGTQRYIYDRRFQQRDKQGNVISILGISTDISSMHTTNQRILAQHEIAKVIESGKSFKDISPLILEIIGTKLDWELGEILLIDPTEKVLECYAIWHNEKVGTDVVTQLRNIHFSKGFGVPGQAWKENAPVWKIDASQPLNILTSTSDKTLFRTAVAVPILYKNKMFGILSFLTTLVIAPSENTQKFLEITGILLGEYLSHKHTEEKILLLADQDHLTGLMTRNRFEEKVQARLEKNPNDFIAVIVLDLDKFKLINETLDYDTGDEALKVIVERLKRLADTNVLSRLGGNKFAIMPNNLENMNQLAQHVYKILSEIKTSLTLREKSVSITASAGVSLFPKDGKDAKQLLKNANLALAKAKQENGDNFQFYTEELPVLQTDQLTMISELKTAIARDELLLYFQPKVSLKTGRIVGAESLIRWQHPTKGFLPPNVFMPIAEENHLMIPMTEWIISEVCNIIHTHKLGIPIAVNLSGEHFKENFNLIGYLNQILKGFHINPSDIELEITETAFMSEAKRNLAVLVDLKRMGFNIAIDDFGTGFSSLSYLKNIAADYIKIDKSFVDNIPQNIDSAIITKAIIDLSHALNKQVIAEGVETVEQLRFLVNEKCDQIQGYYFSKPLPIQELLVLLEQGKKWEIPKGSEAVQ